MSSKHYADSELRKNDQVRQVDVVWKLRWQKRGGHFHCQVYSARDERHTFAKSGDLVVREEEWVSFCQLMLFHLTEEVP